MVLDDGERLERLPETDAVGDDAAAEAVQLVDRADDAVALELEELLPDDRVADAGCRLDDLLLVEFVAAVSEEVVEDEDVDQVRIAVPRERLQQGEEPLLGARIVGKARPLRFEPFAELPLPRVSRTPGSG